MTGSVLRGANRAMPCLDGSPPIKCVRSCYQRIPVTGRWVCEVSATVKLELAALYQEV